MDPALKSTLCPHCGCVLSRKTLLTHRRMYYDEDSDTWVKKRKELEGITKYI